MKKIVVAFSVVFLLLLVAVVYAQDPGMMGQGGYGSWYCPYYGQHMGPGGGYGMGPGMMGQGMMGGGYGMGPGMMGRGMMGQGMMGRGMMGPGYYGQGPECQKFFDETAGLRKDLHNKRFEYSEAYRNPKTTPETIVKLDREIRDLQEKIYAKAPQGCWW